MSISNLDKEQINYLADMIAEGSTLKAAKEYAASVWGITTTIPGLHRRKEIREAIARRKALARQEAREAIDSSLGPVVKALMNNIMDISIQRDELRAKQSSLECDSKEYQALSRVISNLDSNYVKYFKQYSLIMKLGVEEIETMDPDELERANKDIYDAIRDSKPRTYTN